MEPCPKCGAILAPAGELRIEEEACLVYQCEVCAEEVDLLGVMVPAAFTFAVAPDGRILDVPCQEP
jgi:hypothetical protein